MQKKDWIVGGVIIGSIFAVLILLLVLVAMVAARSDSFTSGKGKDQIGYVKINDVMYNPEPVLDHLADLEDNQKIKGILVRLNSPGGSPSASDEIYRALKKLRAKGKVIIASMGNVAASGAYYIACAADTIMASPSTITGSIGVRSQILHTTELMNKIGVKTSTVKSGKFKDLGNPMRDMTPEERKLLQEVSDDIHSQFVDVICEGRGLSREKVKEIADGRILTGRQAKELGLIDTLGNRDDAISLTAGLCGIEGRPGLLKPPRRRRFMGLVQDYTAQAVQKLMVQEYRFLYTQ